MPYIPLDSFVPDDVAFMLPASRDDIPDVSIGDGDRVLLHALDGDYVGYVTAILPAAGFVPTRYRLTVNLWREDKQDWDTLNWLWAEEEQLTLLVKREALTNGERTESGEVVNGVSRGE